MGSRPHPIVDLRASPAPLQEGNRSMIRKTLIPLTAALALVLPAQAFAAPKTKLNFSKSAYAVAENDPAHAATITVFRKGNAKPANKEVIVDYSTTDGSARAG